MKSIEQLERLRPDITMLDAAVAAVPDFVYTFDLDGKFTYANTALCSLLRRNLDEMVGRDFHDLQYPEPLASTLQAQIQEVIDTKGPVRAETLFESASGAGYYEYIFVPILGENGQIQAVAGTTRDVTDRRRMEEELRESQRDSARLVAELEAERGKLRNLCEQAPAFITMLSGPNFVFDFSNEDYYKLVGRRDILGKPLRDALPEVVGQVYIDLLERVYATGEPFVGRGMSVVLEGGDGQPVEHYVDFIYQAIKDASGSITGILVHGTDVTEQLLARQEVERLNAELELRVDERTQQLQLANRELEGFTYSVSHDLRAPLRAIVSSSQILLDDYSEQLEAGAKHELQRQLKAANKLAVLIDELLKLSRISRQMLNKKPVDLTALAETIATDLKSRYAPKICDFQIAPGMVALADPLSLSLLLLNLMENASKFSPAGAQIEIGQTTSEDVPVFWVRDKGIGFDMQYAHKLFQPFERLVTDDQFPGTGIGLANVKRIVERHGGRVWAESELGHGATFFFTLDG
jgi:PAS domain S-box-containing protein